ncbi:hypothetical protein [Clostridium thermobutyricum]|nr:hypothetical protein [Clostridium thermobutyricum]
MKKYIRCFDCGKLKEAYELKIGEISLYTCKCEECLSITRSPYIDKIEE